MCHASASVAWSIDPRAGHRPSAPSAAASHPHELARREEDQVDAGDGEVGEFFEGVAVERDLGAIKILAGGDVGGGDVVGFVVDDGEGVVMLQGEVDAAAEHDLVEGV